MTRKNTFEVTLKSGAKVRFRAKTFHSEVGLCQWQSFTDQSEDRLLRCDPDEVAAVVRLR